MRYQGQQKTKIYRKLRKAWISGMPDRKAALYAGIPPEDLKELLRMDPKLVLTRNSAMARNLDVEVAARMNVNKAVSEGSVDSSKWLLERKVPEEFSTKGQISVQADDFATIEDKKAQLEKMMEKFGE